MRLLCDYWLEPSSNLKSKLNLFRFIDLWSFARDVGRAWVDAKICPPNTTGPGENRNWGTPALLQLVFFVLGFRLPLRRRAV